MRDADIVRDFSFHDVSLQKEYEEVSSYFSANEEKLSQVSEDIKAMEALLAGLYIIEPPSSELSGGLSVGWHPKTKRIIVFGDNFKFRPAVECKVNIRVMAHRGLARLLHKCRGFI